jgi:polyhydroxybutyrate depolymerase
MTTQRHVGWRWAVIALMLAVAPALAEDERPRGPAAKAAPRASIETLQVAGTARTYRLYVPQTLTSRPAPLVVALHGAHGDSEQIERYLGFNAVADREGLIVAYPQGIGSVWNDGRPPELRRRAKGATADDATFLVALVDRLVTSGAVDPARVHVAGLSNGGYMAARLACEASERFAAVAILIASVPRDYRRRCKSKRPVPVLILNGSEDRLAPWEGFTPAGLPRDGEVGIMSVGEHAQFWAVHNGCRDEAETRLNDTAPDDGSVIVRRDWSGCTAGGAVTLYAVEGGGHQTPTPRVGLFDQVIGAFLGPRNRDAETSELLWDFFKSFRR